MTPGEPVGTPGELAAVIWLAVRRPVTARPVAVASGIVAVVVDARWCDVAAVALYGVASSVAPSTSLFQGKQ